MTDGEGVPLVVDAAGNEHTLKLSLQAVARQGQITKIGWGPKPVNCSLDPLLSKCVTLRGTFSHNWQTWESVLAMIQQGVLKMEPMITRRASLEQWREVFEEVENKKIIKAVFIMNERKNS